LLARSRKPAASVPRSESGDWLAAVAMSGSARPSITFPNPSAAVAYSFCSYAAFASAYFCCRNAGSNRRLVSLTVVRMRGDSSSIGA
jgi:hypothetical protein